MNHQVQVFEIDVGGQPTEKLMPIEGFAVTADTLDQARRAAEERLVADGHTIRCLSFLQDGGLAAIVYPPAPPPTKPSRRARAQRGAR